MTRIVFEKANRTREESREKTQEGTIWQVLLSTVFENKT